MINIVIPMAGEGSRFVKAGFKTPKPFIEVEGVPMVNRVMDNVKYPGARFILIGRKSHLEKEHLLVKKIKREYNVEFIGIDKLTEGTACTVLYARKFINNNDPLLIANSDQIVDVDLTKYIDDCFSRKLDGSILTFTDEELNPKWSFAQIDKNGIIQRVAEKDPISEYATVGIYLFSKGSDFVNAAVDMIVENDRVNNEFYTCPVYNYGTKNGSKYGIYNIEFNKMHGLGIPEDLEKYTKHLQSSHT